MAYCECMTCMRRERDELQSRIDTALDTLAVITSPNRATYDKDGSDALELAWQARRELGDTEQER